MYLRSYNEFVLFSHTIITCSTSLRLIYTAFHQLEAAAITYISFTLQKDVVIYKHLSEMVVLHVFCFWMCHYTVTIIRLFLAMHVYSESVLIPYHISNAVSFTILVDLYSCTGNVIGYIQSIHKTLLHICQKLQFLFLID